MDKDNQAGGQKVLLIFHSIIFILVVISSVIFYLLKVDKNSTLKAKELQLQGLNQELNSTELANYNKDIEVFQKGISSYNSFVSSGIPFSKFFSKIKSLTPKEVRFDNLSVSKTKEVISNGESTDISSLAALMVSLNSSSIITDIKLSSVAQSGITNSKSVKFTLIGRLDEKNLEK